MFFVLLFAFLLTASPVRAEEVIAPMPTGPGGPAEIVKPLPPPAEAAPVAETAPVAPAPLAEDPLLVAGILIDKTERNAVVAREQALAEAPRQALQKLAERTMTPEAFKAFKLPDDKTLATLVQDMEIKNEQIADSRYVASFTLRFTPEVRNYLVVAAPVPVAAPAGEAAPPASAAPAVPPPPSAAAYELPTGPRDVLVLPYYENIAGKRVLWEDPNPWREAWQAAGSSTPGVGLTVTAPLGDLNDVSAGSTDVVWSGDYSVIEKLRANYTASEVALAVANRSGINIKVDLYFYRNGNLVRMKTIVPYISATNDAEAFAKTVPLVTAAIQSPEPHEDPAPRPLEPAFITEKPVIEKSVPETAAPETPPMFPPPEALPPTKTTLIVTTTFDHFTQWMEMQKRLASMTPIPVVEISSLAKDTAKFYLTFMGDLDAFQSELGKKGMGLFRPQVVVDPSATEPVAAGAPAPPETYELRLVAAP